MTDVDTINEIYKKDGFEGVISFVEGELELGRITETGDKMYRISTAGWSEDEFLVYVLTDLTSIFGTKHYVGYIRGGAYYFCEEIDDCSFEVVKKE